jgi:hypothetical protein
MTQAIRARQKRNWMQRMGGVNQGSKGITLRRMQAFGKAKVI